MRRHLTEDPDHADYSDIPELPVGHATFQDAEAVVFGILDGRFVWEWGGAYTDADDLFPGGHGVVSHAKLAAVSQYSAETLGDLTKERVALARLLGEGAILPGLDYDEFMAEPDIVEKILGEFGPSFPIKEEFSDEAGFVASVEAYKNAATSTLESVKARLMKLRQALGVDDDGDGDDGLYGSQRLFTLPGRAWVVDGKHGPVIIASFWGEVDDGDNDLDVVMRELAEILGDPASMWYQSSLDELWVQWVEPEDGPGPEGSEPEPEPGPDYDPAIVAEINRLQARLHVSDTEEKQRIRARVADLRELLTGNPADPKAGAGSKRAGKAASAAGYGSVSAFNASRHTESLIRALQTACRDQAHSVR